MNLLCLFSPHAFLWVAVLTNLPDVPVREAGTLESASVIEIQAPFEAAILELIPEGKHVKKGDLLLELDSSALQDLLQQQIVKVTGLQAQETHLDAQLNQLKVRLTVEEKVKSLADEVRKRR